MAAPVNLGVNDARGILSYDCQALGDQKIGTFRFFFEDVPGDPSYQVGVFNIVGNDGTLLRQNRSHQFPRGAVNVTSQRMDWPNYKVSARVTNGKTLSEYFDV